MSPVDLGDPRHAWFVLGGVLLGLLISAGFAAWLVRRVEKLMDKAEKTLDKMTDAIDKALALQKHVSAEYAPLRNEVAELKRRVDAIVKYDGGSA